MSASASELATAAWDLADHARGSVADDESGPAIFVMLGVGDYLEAIEALLTVLIACAGPPVSTALHARLEAICQRYYVGSRLTNLVAAVPRTLE